MSVRDRDTGQRTGKRVGPLAGIRIVDLTSFQSGPMVTLMAGDLGAEIIKVEAVQRLDGWRGSGRGGDRPWELSPNFNWVNRNKHGITLNLTDPRGADILRSLVAVSDVVVENYTPRVMANFGLDYATLAEIRPNLIMVSMPGLGGTGRWRDFTAFAWTTEQMSTICQLTGYEDSGPLFTGTTCGDPLAGLMGAVALMAAINHRRRTGEGQHIDLSQVEASTSFVGDALIEAQLEEAEPLRRGNRHPEMVPHGVYPTQGDDRWIAVACRDDDDWRRLWAEIAPGRDIWLPTVGERLLDQEQVESQVAAWAAPLTAHEAMHRLQAAGVPAGVVMDGEDIFDDPHLGARGFHMPIERDMVGLAHYPAEPFRMANNELPSPHPAPFVGQANHEVLAGLVGLTEDQIVELERDHVIGTTPL